MPPPFPLLLLLCCCTLLPACPATESPSAPSPSEVTPASISLRSSHCVHPASKDESTSDWPDMAVAGWVNGVPMLLSEVQDRAAEQTAGVLDQALVVLAEEELVAHEARQAGVERLDGESPGDQAQRFLNLVFGEETLCRHVSDGEIRMLYEATYQKEWPARMFAGDVIEVRCDSGDGSIPPEEVADCLATNRLLMAELERLTDSFEDEDTPEWLALKQRFPRLHRTAFTFLDYVALTPEQQTRNHLFDPKTRRQIMALELGQISPPMESPVGYHLVRLRAFRPAITPESPEFRQKAAKELCRRKVQVTQTDYRERLRSAARLDDGEMVWPGREPKGVLSF